MGDDVCTICRDVVNQGTGEKDSLVLKCNHAFHVECIFQYAIDAHQCPNCRYDLRTKTEQPRLQYDERSMTMSASLSTCRLGAAMFMFIGMVMTMVLTILIILALGYTHSTSNDGLSPTSIIITNTTMHVCSSPTNCRTLTTLKNASQRAWVLLSRSHDFWEQNRTIIEGRSLANLLHGLLEECGV